MVSSARSADTPLKKIMLNDIEQIQQLLHESKHILITFRKDGTGDAIASAIALSLFLQKQNKHVDIVVDEFILPKKFSFLPHGNEIKPQFPHLQKFIISLDLKNSGVQELSYDVNGDKLQIYITPKTGSITRDQVHTAQSDFRYDLIITLDTPDLHSLGNLTEMNTALFYALPIINIDYKANNERYGQINHVVLTTTSTSEAVAEIIRKISETDIDKTIATALLTGMIANTNSFKTKDIKPHTLSLASYLIGLGADREIIISELYRTKSLSALKLWGQALTHLEFESNIGLATTTITREDFNRTGATEHELYDIIDELIANSPEAKLIAIIHEHRTDITENQIHIIVHSNNHHDLLDILKEFHPEGNIHRVSLKITGKTLAEAEQIIKAELQKNLTK
jgi:nanoRNase/pAp phosphatase (c-di-AMP/oligoRNAs hydrolase)